jgi:hypothetical protein
MAITTNACALTGPFAAQLGAARWSVNGSSADASGCETLKATPGAGYSLCITRLFIYLGAAITATIGSGTNAGAVETVLVGPLGGAAGTYVLDLRETPIVLDANKALTVDASAAGAICVYAEGFTRTA